MQTNDITPIDQTPDEKKSSRTAFVLAGVAALGLAAALGAGFMLGGRGDGVRAAGVSGAYVTPTQESPASPTASVVAQASQSTDGAAGDASGGEIAPAPGGTGSDASTGDPPVVDPTPDARSAPPAPPVIDRTPDAGSAPPPLPPCPACPPVGPGIIEPLPEDPPVAPPLTPCLACPPIDPGIIVPVPPVAPAAPLLPPPPPCLVCGPILPGIIVHADATPPVISGVDFHPCVGRVSVSFDVNEHADLWVTYTDGGAARTTAHQSGVHGDFALTGGPLSPIRNIVLHAADDAGNESALALASASYVCL